MIWNSQMECATKSQMKNLQLERLRTIVKYAYENVQFYQKKFDAIGLKPSHIVTLLSLEAK